MKYSCHTLDNGTWKLRTTDFLTDAATAFLDECDVTIFDKWKETFPSHKSLSPIVNSEVIDPLENLIDAIDTSKISRFRTLRAFNNAKYSGDTCLSMFREFKENSDAEIVVYIASAEFKKKFRFDSTYMTLDGFVEYYVEFVRIMEPRRIPIIHFVTLEDLPFETAIYEKGKDKYLKLIYEQAN